MSTVPIIAPGIRGIDGKSDPLTLGTRKLKHANNLAFEEGTIKTRPGIYYRSMGLQGQFQGATLFRPSLGLSVKPFGHSGSQIATAVSGGIYLNGVTTTSVSCQPVKLAGTEEEIDCEEKDPKCRGDINLFQAENYLIVQNRQGPTFWWNGNGILERSLGMTADAEQDTDHSHDSFRNDVARNWLTNGAGLGIYAHGRIHQENGNRIYVSDMIHKRGVLTTDDILKMEEQSLASCGPPLSTSSKMGQLLALEIAPQMNTAYGEGVLVGYYEGGVVAYNTAEAPRETRYRFDNNNWVAYTQGWDTKRLVDTRLNSVSAVGRYAVAPLPRDQFFRSPFGVHLLSQTMGQETLADEPVQTISQEVEPILLADDPDALYGSACGYWMRGQRYFVTTGMQADEKYSSAPCGRGFVSWNKVFRRTEDRTPIPVWEGVWTIDDGMFGIHKFTHIGLRQDAGNYGFIGSNTDRQIYFGDILSDMIEDVRDGKSMQIPWAFETGRFAFSSLSVLKTISDARFESVVTSSQTKIKVFIRTDRKPVWQKWREFCPCDRTLCAGQKLLKGHALGQPPEGYREASWFEFRMEGVGWAEIKAFDVEVTESKVSAGNSLCVVLDCQKTNFLNPCLE